MNKVDTTRWQRMDYINFYAKIWGVPVIPINKDKKPMLKWTPYQTTIPTEQELSNWFVKLRAWGLAIICQRNLFSPDIDTPELYEMLSRSGAFDKGTCIYSSVKGYHTIMRSSDIVPYSVREHSEVLAAINPLLYDFGISGNNQLAIVPDTPDRHWIELYDEPIAVPYEAWLEKYLSWSKRLASTKVEGGRWINVFCPWCEFDGKPHESPSCSVDLEGRGYNCHGTCGRRGKLSEFVEYAEKIRYPLPKEIIEANRQYHQASGVEIGGKDKQAAPILEVPLTKYVPSMPSESLIEGLAETRDRVAIAAPPAEGKTVKIQCLAAQAAKGLPVWGRFAVPRPLKVALVEEELTGERPKQIVDYIGESIGAIPLENLRLYRAQKWIGKELVEAPFEITNDEDMEQLTQALIRYKPDIIILDGWFKFVVNQENEDLIVNKAIEWMDTITNATNACLIVVCHTRKAVPLNVTAGRFDQISGKGLHRWARTKLILRRMSEEWGLYSRLYGSSSNPMWGDLLYLLHWNPETWITTVVSKEQAPGELWSKVYPDSSKAETRDLMLRARAVGLSDKDIADIAGVTDRAVRYWRTGGRAMTGYNKHLLLTRIQQLEKARGLR